VRCGASAIDYPLEDAQQAKVGGVNGLTMLAYSALLTAGLVLSAPWWLLWMATTERYREGLWQRLGAVPRRLTEGPHGYGFLTKVVWVHAVSVGEVLAATRLVAELEKALGEGWGVVVSTTTRTGQALARERFGAERVFYMPLDFAWAVRAYLVALRPSALVLMESELWPRMLHECRKMGVPVAVVNARVSDRSFARGLHMKWLWSRVLRGVTLWLAQSEEDERRLVAMGAQNVSAIGNLKYDVRAPKISRVAELIRNAAAERPVIVAGSTGEDFDGYSMEDELCFNAWLGKLSSDLRALLVVAPRHPEKFAEAEGRAMPYRYVRASDWSNARRKTYSIKGAPEWIGPSDEVEIVIVDTIGDLAAIYGVADVAFVGGSLVQGGGHNPLEPAQFGVPVVMGPSFENFRDIVGRMQQVEAIRIVRKEGELEQAFIELLTDREAAKAMGERGRRVFEEQQGATARAVEAIVAMVNE
jgi:3-deoxy-D-manno-octulosonic-acid transferase